MDAKMMAKKAMLKSLKKEMMDMMGEERSDLKDVLGKKLMKVTVASDSKEGLAKGLEKAEDIMEKKSEEESEGYECDECGDMGCPACEEGEESEEASEEMDKESPEALKAQIEELKKQLAAKSE